MYSENATLHQGRCNVAEMSGGALLRVSVYSIMPYLVILRKAEK